MTTLPVLLSDIVQRLNATAYTLEGYKKAEREAQRIGGSFLLPSTERLERIASDIRQQAKRLAQLIEQVEYLWEESSKQQ